MICLKCDDVGEIYIAYGERYLCDCAAGEALRKKRLHDDYSPGDRAIDAARERAEERLTNAVGCMTNEKEGKREVMG